MAERSIVAIGKNGNSITIVVPRPLLHRLGWQRGTRLMLEAREGCLVAAELEDAMVGRAFDRLPARPPAAPGGYGR